MSPMLRTPRNTSSNNTTTTTTTSGGRRSRRRGLNSDGGEPEQWMALETRYRGMMDWDPLNGRWIPKQNKKQKTNHNDTNDSISNDTNDSHTKESLTQDTEVQPLPEALTGKDETDTKTTDKESSHRMDDKEEEKVDTKLVDAVKTKMDESKSTSTSGIFSTLSRISKKTSILYKEIMGNALAEQQDKEEIQKLISNHCASKSTSRPCEEDEDEESNNKATSSHEEDNKGATKSASQSHEDDEETKSTSNHDDDEETKSTSNHDDDEETKFSSNHDDEDDEDDEDEDDDFFGIQESLGDEETDDGEHPPHLSHSPSGMEGLGDTTLGEVGRTNGSRNKKRNPHQGLSKSRAQSDETDTNPVPALLPEEPDQDDAFHANIRTPRQGRQSKPAAMKLKETSKKSTKGVDRSSVTQKKKSRSIAGDKKLQKSATTKTRTLKKSQKQVVTSRRSNIPSTKAKKQVPSSRRVNLPSSQPRKQNPESGTTTTTTSTIEGTIQQNNSLLRKEDGKLGGSPDRHYSLGVLFEAAELVRKEVPPNDTKIDEERFFHSLTLEEEEEEFGSEDDDHDDDHDNTTFPYVDPEIFEDALEDDDCIVLDIPPKVLSVSDQDVARTLPRSQMSLDIYGPTPRHMAETWHKIYGGGA